VTAERIPPCAVFTHEQLAEIVRRPVQTAAGRAEIDGGGSWNSDARNVRAANRNANPRGDRDDQLGLRLASAPTRPRAEADGAAPDQTAVATAGARRRRTPTGPRRAK
jgi:hypothetical protein